FGWPNLSLTPTGGFMGMPASTLAGDMRVIDMYRREGDKLAENWIFIDLLHFWKMQGVDILERMQTLPRT
ncbi:ester cyclase, partial [bacterium]|nr:ester cyclase [bacterium]